MLPDPSAPSPGLYFSAGGLHWFRPSTLSEAIELRSALVQAFAPEQVRLVVGHTARAIYPTEIAAARYLIDVSQLAELNVREIGRDGLRVGASVPIQRLVELAETAIERQAPELTAGLRALVRHARFLAGIQVRNAGSVGGNIAIARGHTRAGEPFPSDLFTILAALDARLAVSSASFEGGTQNFPLDELPALEDLPVDALFVELVVPWTRPGTFVRTYRAARRPQMAHPIVNAGFRCQLDTGGNVVPGTLGIVYGGLDASHRRLFRTEHALTGQKWNDATLRAVICVLEEEVGEITVAMEGEGFTTAYRRQLALSFFYKFFVHVAAKVCPEEVAPANLSAGVDDARPLSHGRQVFPVEAEAGSVTRPIVKQAALAQASGEIRYTQDEPLPSNGEHGVLVLSRRAACVVSLLAATGRA